MTTRTQDEIVTRIHDIPDDFMGYRREVLIAALDFEHASEFLKPDVTPEEWAIYVPADLLGTAKNYCVFALGKLRDHRGISASRSVEKLGEYAWLLGRDDVVAVMEAADYFPYGAPMVHAFATGFGLAWPTSVEMTRMAAGKPCRPTCEEGCNR